MTYLRQLAGTAVLVAAAFLPAAAQSNDVDYTAKIRELTSTDPKWKFTSELVDHLPASSRVPAVCSCASTLPGNSLRSNNRNRERAGGRGWQRLCC